MSLLKPTLFAILLSCGALGLWLLNPGTQDSSLAQLERLSGGDFCSDGGVKDGDEALGLTAALNSRNFEDGSFSVGSDPETYRKLAVSRFDTAETRCLDMTFVSSALGLGPGRQTKIRRNAGSIDIDGRRLPLIISRLVSDGVAERPVESAQTIYVRVGGGPGGVNVTAQLDATMDYFEGDYLIDFYYTGHGFNIVHPDPSFEIAVGQLQTFLKQLRTRNPTSKIVVLGESLGAVLSLEALKETKNLSQISTPVVDRLVLLSPPFGSLDRTGQLIRELQVAQGAEGVQFPYRIRDVGQNYNDYGDILSIDSREVFKKFYQERHGNIDLAGRVSNLDGSLPILVIYGNADVRIDLEKAAAFASQEMSNVEVIRIEGMDHQPVSLDEFHSIREELGYFVDE